jgi:hypothetical protein
MSQPVTTPRPSDHEASSKKRKPKLSYARWFISTGNPQVSQEHLLADNAGIVGIFDLGTTIVKQ